MAASRGVCLVDDGGSGRAVGDEPGDVLMKSKAARLVPPPLDGQVIVTWSDGSSAGWNITDGYADALFETIAGDLGKPFTVISRRGGEDE